MNLLYWHTGGDARSAASNSRTARSLRRAVMFITCESYPHRKEEAYQVDAEINRTVLAQAELDMYMCVTAAAGDIRSRRAKGVSATDAGRLAQRGRYRPEKARTGDHGPRFCWPG
jgi:hypothetical protein